MAGPSEHPAAGSMAGDATRVEVGKHHALLTVSVTLACKCSHFVPTSWKKHTVWCSVMLLSLVTTVKALFCTALIPRSKSKALHRVLFPQAQNKICSLCFPLVKCVFFGRDAHVFCFGQLGLCLYLKPFPSELWAFLLWSLH